MTPEFETSSVKCKFLGDDDGIKSCKIEYGQNCNNLSHISQGNPTATDTVVIGITLLDNTVSQYCYVLTASNGTDTVAVSGVFTRGRYSVFRKSEYVVFSLCTLYRNIMYLFYFY